MYICEGPRQVTVIVFTPPPPGEGDAREHSQEQLTEDEPIWVVKKEDGSDTTYTDRGGGEVQRIDAGEGIILRRVRYAGTPRE